MCEREKRVRRTIYCLTDYFRQCPIEHNMNTFPNYSFAEGLIQSSSVQIETIMMLNGLMEITIELISTLLTG